MRVGLALSGGGIRGAAHIGVLKAFKEHNIPVDMIAGTSAGSIVAALYAVGYTASEIEEIFLKFDTSDNRWFEWSRFFPFLMDLLLLRQRQRNGKLNLIDFDFFGLALFAVNWFVRRGGKIDGFIKGNIIENAVRDYCVSKNAYTMKDAVIPIAIPAVDINSARTIMFVSDKNSIIENKDIDYIDDAYIWEAVRASSAFPVVFKPKMFRGRRLVDGGISDNVPAGILKIMGADKVVAVNLGYSGQIKEEIDNIIEIASQSIDIMAYNLSKIKLQCAEYVLKPEIYDVKLLETDRIAECIQRGYIAAQKAIPEIRRALNLTSTVSFESSCKLVR